MQREYLISVIKTTTCECENVKFAVKKRENKFDAFFHVG